MRAEKPHKKKETVFGVDLLGTPPPVIAAFFVFVAFGVGLTLPGPFNQPVRCLPLGFVFLVLGLGVMLWALFLFHRRGTTLYPTGRASKLVIEGPFRFSRNPLYLGATAALLSGVFFWGEWPALIVPFGFFMVMDRVLIPFEERHLQKHLGAVYRDYRKRVRRWL
ncbi:MAG: isoprenylcysteine carboxylmethyltransferase family protein [Alphaproteobacteria bacterium]|nr:isoprenylcysteine carboxylmethyltransferase family protein [Alphaproteobacteria bacterium]